MRRTFRKKNTNGPIFDANSIKTDELYVCQRTRNNPIGCMAGRLSRSSGAVSQRVIRDGECFPYLAA